MNYIYLETPLQVFDCYIFPIRVYNNIKIKFNNVLLHYCIEKIHSLLFLKKLSLKHAFLKCLYLTLTLALALTLTKSICNTTVQGIVNFKMTNPYLTPL